MEQVSFDRSLEIHLLNFWITGGGYLYIVTPSVKDLRRHQPFGRYKYSNKVSMDSEHKDIDRSAIVHGLVREFLARNGYKDALNKLDEKVVSSSYAPYQQKLTFSRTNHSLSHQPRNS